jgi:hypothetical protein
MEATKIICLGTKKNITNFLERNEQILMKQIDIYREQKVQSFLLEGT